MIQQNNYSYQKSLIMKTTISARTVRKQLCQLIEATRHSHKSITITGKANNAVLISEEDWNAIIETLYLSAIPATKRSLMKGMATKIDNCSTRITW
jgi:antitoxin YefM